MEKISQMNRSRLRNSLFAITCLILMIGIFSCHTKKQTVSSQSAEQSSGEDTSAQTIRVIRHHDVDDVQLDSVKRVLMEKKRQGVEDTK